MNRALVPMLVLTGLILAGCQGKKSASGIKTAGDGDPAAASARFGGIGPSRQPPMPPPAVAMPLAPALREKSLEIVHSSYQSPQATIRAHALESIRMTTGAEDAALVLTGMDDPSPMVRSAALLAAGDLKLPNALPKARQLADAPDAFVAITARYAMHRLGDTSRSQALVSYSRDANPRVRGMTAMVLGMLGEPSALKILLPMQADRDVAVRFQVAEAMWKLGDEEGLQTILGAIASLYRDDQMAGLLALGGFQDPRLIQHARPSLTSDYADVRLVAARACGAMGFDDGYAIAAASAKAVDTRQRFLAAFALGAIGRSDAQPLLSPLLSDDDADVRLAAATAILRLRPPG